MKKVVSILVAISVFSVIFCPSVFAWNRRNQRDLKVAGVTVGSLLILNAILPKKEPRKEVVVIQHRSRPCYYSMSAYEQAYWRERNRIQAQKRLRKERADRERAKRDARIDEGWN